MSQAKEFQVEGIVTGDAFNTVTKNGRTYCSHQVSYEVNGKTFNTFGTRTLVKADGSSKDGVVAGQEVQLYFTVTTKNDGSGDPIVFCNIGSGVTADAQEDIIASLMSTVSSDVPVMGS